jgi:hypothetical protein
MVDDSEDGAVTKAFKNRSQKNPTPKRRGMRGGNAPRGRLVVGAAVIRTSVGRRRPMLLAAYRVFRGCNGVVDGRYDHVIRDKNGKRRRCETMNRLADQRETIVDAAVKVRPSRSPQGMVTVEAACAAAAGGAASVAKAGVSKMSAAPIAAPAVARTFFIDRPFKD